MIDIRQTDQFANFMKDIGWQIEKLDSTYVYIRKMPILGNFAKIPRPQPIFDYQSIINLKKKLKAYQLKIAPFISSTDKNYKKIRNTFLNLGFKTEYFPFNPTTTLQINLTKSEEKLFKNLTEAKRRAVRKATKNEVAVVESNNIEEFINIRKRQYFPLGFMIVPEMKASWKKFYPENASLLLAYYQTKPVGGILLLFYDNVAYYWFASSLKIGKKLFAPTLLVWEALKRAKKRGCKTFDFEGIYDERFPKASENWRGFTKFKEGFGGKKIVFMENFLI
ncbi:hypothetical protein A2960_04700 [Candidatus Gottesmanbacteria bacterium RIFCSPLOWO2_01_FULL_39_12b]|uniref:N-acetyltransferase domain-containing protein n=1 Tax=Candidatus Gottesmanbacteria bacterium RIFCSPLOWO2_01_FULL_39_12b TaxID=1798388 RepID=A0A1F6ANK7_9BACT|nr:MAG: hypothetical protein A2960_04700 [Candidatus Gottesmanbacteria bacterium RIFCSPLOWO2_01_FULL_39_12b]